MGPGRSQCLCQGATHPSHVRRREVPGHGAPTPLWAVFLFGLSTYWSRFQDRAWVGDGDPEAEGRFSEGTRDTSCRPKVLSQQSPDP